MTKTYYGKGIKNNLYLYEYIMWLCDKIIFYFSAQSENIYYTYLYL